MTILLDYRPALRARTGVGEYGHELAAALARGSRPTDRLILFTSSLRDRPAPGLAADWPRTVVVDRRVPVRLLNRAWHRLEWPPVEWLAGPVDVALSLHPLAIPTARARSVITVHDLDFLRHPERTAAEIRRDYPALVKRHAARAGLVVVNSRDTAAAVASELGVPPARTVLCQPGLPGWIRESPEPPPPARQGYVLFMGTLEPRKNVGGLLDAWERVIARTERPPMLRLAGGVSPVAGPWLDRLRRPPLAGHVEYVGYVDEGERRAAYAGARALVLPSFHEGFGLPALEAMALGVPVVASTRGALPEVVGDAGLLVDPDDTDALAAALRQVLEDDRLADGLRARGLARAAAFTWDRAASTLRDALDQLLSEPGPPDAHRG